jgi:hypothetical protein
MWEMIMNAGDFAHRQLRAGESFQFHWKCPFCRNSFMEARVSINQVTRCPGFADSATMPLCTFPGAIREKRAATAPTDAGSAGASRIVGMRSQDANF